MSAKASPFTALPISYDIVEINRRERIEETRLLRAENECLRAEWERHRSFQSLCYRWKTALKEKGVELARTYETISPNV